MALFKLFTIHLNICYVCSRGQSLLDWFSFLAEKSVVLQIYFPTLISLFIKALFAFLGYSVVHRKDSLYQDICQKNSLYLPYYGKQALVDRECNANSLVSLNK